MLLSFVSTQLYDAAKSEKFKAKLKKHVKLYKYGIYFVPLPTKSNVI